MFGEQWDYVLAHEGHKWKTVSDKSLCFRPHWKPRGSQLLFTDHKFPKFDCFDYCDVNKLYSISFPKSITNTDNVHNFLV